MFFSLGVGHVLGVMLAFVLVGFWLIPTPLLTLLLGVLAFLGGLVMLFSSPIAGIALIVIGPVLVVIGVRIRKRQEREEDEAGEAAAQQVTGAMTPYIPKEK